MKRALFELRWRSYGCHRVWSCCLVVTCCLPLLSFASLIFVWCGRCIWTVSFHIQFDLLFSFIHLKVLYRENLNLNLELQTANCLCYQILFDLICGITFQARIAGQIPSVLFHLHPLKKFDLTFYDKFYPQ